MNFHAIGHAPSTCQETHLYFSKRGEKYARENTEFSKPKEIFDDIVMFSVFEGKYNVKTLNQVNPIAKPNNCLSYVQQNPSTEKKIKISH